MTVEQKWFGPDGKWPTPPVDEQFVTGMFRAADLCERQIRKLQKLEKTLRDAGYYFQACNDRLKKEGEL